MAQKGLAEQAPPLQDALSIHKNVSIIMKNVSRAFSYTALRGSYISIVSALLFIVMVEGGVIALLIARLIPNELIKLVLSCLLAALYLFISSKLLAPLWTKHRLDARSLELHYGFDFKADVPRNTIIAAQQVRERVALPVARYEAEKKRLVAAFSEQGQVLLRLDQPYPFRMGFFSRTLANQILINVDQREEFLAVLNLATTSAEKSTLSTKAQLDLGESQGPFRVTPPFEFTGVRTLAIRTENLTRRYKSFTAVDELNLAVQTGEIYGFLGSNGAGKTTALKMLAGLLVPSAGRAWISGHDMWNEPLVAKAALGYVADRSMLYDRLTGREFLAFLAQVRGIQQLEADTRIEHLLDLLELKDRADTACGTYSFGMKRKLAIAGSLIHEPPVLILDEPLNGLDPLSARRLKDLFAELAAGGKIIFLSTHDLATAESICHRVGIIHKGRLLVEGSASELRQVASAPDLEAVFLTLTAEETGVPV
jgi:ABC-2 type transport system ATP-binding protein